MQSFSAIALSDTYTHPYITTYSNTKPQVTHTCRYLRKVTSYVTMTTLTLQENNNAYDGEDLLHLTGGSRQTGDQQTLCDNAYQAEEAKGLQGSWRISSQTTGFRRVCRAGNQENTTRELTTSQKHFEPPEKLWRVTDGP